MNSRIQVIGRCDERLRWVDFVRRSLPERVLRSAMAETPVTGLDLANWGELVDFF
jgi:hypothetical protein